MNEVLDPVQDILDQVFGDTETTKSHCVVVFNDDVNSFDQAIGGIMVACGHDQIKAEQLAVIIHTKGKAQVLSDTYDKCVIAHALLTAGFSLNAEVQEL